MAKKPDEENGAEPSVPKPANKRNALTLTDLPNRPLRDVLRVPQALIDNYASGPTAPHDLAMALGLSPTSSTWRDLAVVSMAYGLTKGGWNATKIALEQMGQRATEADDETEKLKARAEAVLKPKVFGGFFRKYNKANPMCKFILPVAVQNSGVVVPASGTAGRKACG